MKSLESIAERLHVLENRQTDSLAEAAELTSGQQGDPLVSLHIQQT